jgi:glycine betaine catabolism A
MNGSTSVPLQAALPKEMYVDDARWQVERERVLFGSWFCIGRVDDLGVGQPGRVAVVDVIGESVLVTSDDNGVLHGAYNVCRHRGSQLMPVEPGAPTTTCGALSLRCPYHSWTYSLSGEMLRAPHTEGLRPEEFSLHPVAVDTWGGFVFVHLTPGDGVEPLADAVAGPGSRLARYGLPDLLTGKLLSYDVRANYKVLAENYNECYHCGPVHPELCRLVPAFASGGADIDWEAGVPHREGAWTFTSTGTTTRSPLPGLDDDERTHHKGELVYPNLLLSCSADHVAAFVLRPLAVDRTAIDCYLLFAAGEVRSADFDPSDAVELWDLVNGQDWAICESVQRGMSSRSYQHGWFAEMENDSLDIRRWLLPRLEGSP